MTTAFENLPPDKRHKILSVAIEEFATHGYDNASTNRIVERAEIAKGLLFHYFKNKKGLYTYVCSYCVDIVIQVYERFLPTSDRDIFARLKQLLIIKIQQIAEFPLEYDLLQKAMVVAQREGFEELAGIFGKLTAEWTGKIFEDMDLAKFRPGTDIQKAIEIISWTLEAFGKKYTVEQTDAEGRLVMDSEALIRGMDEYVALLKAGLYA